MSLLSLQSQNDAPPAVTTALQDARSRIQSMMIVYDKLYRSADFRNVSLREYLTPLIDEIVASYTISAKITVEKLIDDFPLHAEKLFPVGLILNELLTNAMKYAFDGRSSGRIVVTVSRTASGIVLVVHDDGPGLPEAALSGRSAGFGIKLVEMMMTQVFDFALPKGSAIKSIKDLAGKKISTPIVTAGVTHALPSPFCVLDEVDAMLDEANVGRFRDLLKELSAETQFVVITHNRNTVQAADVIYGVTMGRDSASQVISLKLDDISDEMLGRSRG